MEATLWDAHLVAEMEVAWGSHEHGRGELSLQLPLVPGAARFPEKKVGFLHVPPFDEVPRERQAEMLARVLANIESPANAGTRSV